MADRFLGIALADQCQKDLDVSHRSVARFLSHSAQQLARFRLPIRFLRWICLIATSSVCWFRLPIADAILWQDLPHCQYVSLLHSAPIADLIFWLDLFHFQYISLLDSAPNSWWDSVAGFAQMPIHII